ncbi:hypothetical protein [Dyella psychrodurans]|uniref:hypothetical protein n=1 Tax=Dyella psychrodurans TaxID=1927960 RepID=UPI0013142559|nr:hypothetical protein [Dyella psychrodurans]
MTRRDVSNHFTTPFYLTVIPAQAGIQCQHGMDLPQKLNRFRHWIPACAEALYNGGAGQ